MTGSFDREKARTEILRLHPNMPRYFVDVLLDVYQDSPAKLNEMYKAETKKDRQRKKGGEESEEKSYMGPYARLENPSFEDGITWGPAEPDSIQVEQVPR